MSWRSGARRSGPRAPSWIDRERAQQHPLTVRANGDPMSRAVDAPDLTLIGFLQAQNCSNYAGSWRHPEATHRLPQRRVLPAHRAARSRPASSTSPSSTTAWRCPTCYGGDHASAVAHGIRVRQDGPDRRPHRDGHGDEQPRPRRAPTRRPTTSRSTSPACSRRST